MIESSAVPASNDQGSNDIKYGYQTRRRISEMRFTIFLAACAATAAPVVSLHPSNVGVGSLSYTVEGTTITITEDWTSMDPGALQISGLELGTNYLVIKRITNNTGASWNRLAIELLDPSGQGNDVFDPMPYPDFVPAGYTTSNQDDGLSFAEDAGIPQKSSVFGSVRPAEVADERDFLDFFGGTGAIGATFTVQFGLRNQVNLSNEPFLLFQRPNTSSVPDGAIPEPTTLVLAATGTLILGLRKSFLS